MDTNDIVIGGRSLDTPNRRGNTYGFHSSASFERYHLHHCHHPYKRSERGYLPKDFKKAKPPTFDGEMNRSEDAEAWMLGMKKFFRSIDYLENMEANTTTFSLKGK